MVKLLCYLTDVEIEDYVKIPVVVLNEDNKTENGK